MAQISKEKIDKLLLQQATKDNHRKDFFSTEDRSNIRSLFNAGETSFIIHGKAFTITPVNGDLYVKPVIGFVPMCRISR